MGDWAWRDDRWVHDPDLPTPITASDYDPSATRLDLPAVGARVEYAGHVDYAPTSERAWCEDRPAAELSDDDGRD